MKAIATLVCLVVLAGPREAAAQWRLGVDVGTGTFWGSSIDTSGMYYGSSFRPYHPTSVGLRLERRMRRITVALGIGVISASLILLTGDLGVLSPGAFKQLHVAPELAVGLVQLDAGPRLLLHAGPLFEIWTVEFEDERSRWGAQAGLSLEFPLGRRVHGVIAARGGVTPSVFTVEELPSEYERRTSWRAGVSLGLRFGR